MPKPGEVAQTPALLLLPHAGPHVGVEDVGAARRLARVGGELDGAAGLARDLDHSRVGLVALRRGRDELHPELRGAPPSALADVVAVADPGDGSPPAGPAAPGWSSRRRAPGTGARVGETVDHRDRGVARQLLDVGMIEGADHDAVEVAREHARGVPDRLAPAELDVGAARKSASPPSWKAPTSNETRVRVEGFGKIIPSVRPGRRWCSSRRAWRSLRSSARSRSHHASGGVGAVEAARAGAARRPVGMAAPTADAPATRPPSGSRTSSPADRVHRPRAAERDEGEVAGVDADVAR